MSGYPGAPDFNSNQVDFSNATAFQVAPGETFNIVARFNASSWGQSVIVHELPYSDHPILLGPSYYSPGGAAECSKSIDKPGGYMVSAWAWYGGTAAAMPGPNVWRQVPKVSETPPLPAGVTVKFVGPDDPYQAPGPAGNVNVTCSRDNH